MSQQALIAGATGLIGRALLHRLAHDETYDGVTALVRKPAGMSGGWVTEQCVDFDQLAHATLPAVDTVFCTLGTTIKQAGSQAAFRKVDLDYVVSLAKVTRALGARHFLVVSAMGVKPDSRVFYNRVKADMEAVLRDIDFPQLTIFRPSLLLGEREEFRLGERVAAKFGWLMPANYRPIEAEVVAEAMARLGRQAGQGVRVVESAEIRHIAAQ